MRLRLNGTLPLVTARAAIRGGGMTFSGVAVILRPSAGRVVIETETESGERH